MQEAIQTIETSFEWKNAMPTGENIVSDGLTHNADLRQTWNKLDLTLVPLRAAVDQMVFYSNWIVE